MKKNIEEILKNYNIEYIITPEYIELWRNGRTTKINQPVDKDNLSLYLDFFGVYSPHSTKELKEAFPFYFDKPQYGETIFVKKIGGYVEGYQMRKFKEFRNGKIICVKDIENEKSKETEYDFYSKYIGDDRHPTTTFWHNGKENHITWAVMEKIMNEHFPIKHYEV